MAKTTARKKPKAKKTKLRAVPDKLWFMYRKMSEIRLFEEHVWDVYTRGLMPGLAHLYIGEEGVAVGTCAALRDDDYITSTHRGHGHCLAKGGQLDRMMAEIMGKEAGYCRGKGGSMHIADMSLGILGANGIVGGGFGICTGAGLSAKLRGSDQVGVCFFGDGAANQGIMLETINMAVDLEPAGHLHLREQPVRRAHPLRERHRRHRHRRPRQGPWPRRDHRRRCRCAGDVRKSNRSRDQGAQGRRPEPDRS